MLPAELKRFTDIDSPYEVPESPELRIDTVRLMTEEAAAAMIEYLRGAGVLQADTAPGVAGPA